MKRFILEITEEEKNRIRFLHEKVRSSLFEQENVTQEGQGKISNQVMVPTDEDANLLLGGSGDQTVKTFIDKTKRNNGSVDLNSQLVSSYGDTYKTFIQGLSEGSGKNAQIWYLQLTQDSRIAFLNQWKAYLETANRKIQKGKQDVKINLIEGKPTTKKVELPSNITTAPEPITFLKEFNEIGKGMNVYEDNKSEVTPFMQGEIQKIITAAQEIINNAKISNANVVCTNLIVTASSSRLRNTNEASGKTWLDLSKERAENVKNSLVTGLKGVGVSVPNNVIELKGGFNGDGTSGPNPPRKDKNGKSYTLTSDGKTIIKDTDEERNKPFPNGGGTITTPSTNIDDYLQFKFCIINVTFQVVWSSLSEDIKEYEEITFKNYTMEIEPKYKLKLGIVKLPKNGFGTKLIPNPSSNTKKRLDICPAFG